MNIGVLGGTFDPIHTGHLIIAEQAREILHLGKIIFIPAGQPWLKKEQDITPFKYRADMVRRAIKGNPSFEICTIEGETPGPSYSVDTIGELRKELGVQNPIFFILGYDSLAEMFLWHQPEKLVQLCHLVAIPRQGASFPSLKSMEAKVAGVKGKVLALDLPVIDISSSQIRHKVSRGVSVRYQVPDAVDSYIKEHQLYL